MYESGCIVNLSKGPLHKYVTPKMAIFHPPTGPTHPVTLGHVSLDPPPSMTYLLFMIWVRVFLWTPQKHSITANFKCEIEFDGLGL